MEIREATPADAAAMAGIHVRGWRWAYRGLLPDAYLDGLSVKRWTGIREQRMRQARPEAAAWVASEDGAPVGFASAGPSRDLDAGPRTGEVYAIYVEPELTGRGFGRVLLEHAVACLRARGFGPLTLWVLRANERARRFYEAAGWRTDGAAKVEDRDGLVLDEVRYRLDPARTREG